ncbi:DEHA2A13112p [Debaryomyces hansenii CBS767]|uniref:pH-response regulator protein palF/RIM8 n=1 Tax=Debaryomyces hansenii (strain ATCC 36239 / CBS 767 / BCRC 21394 / JCM 1990 / NBRC 0083 / IGC 2968) TaxID=284592 RepID=PALF_DEBHA|nr:DEHA2A13112p [Debaryomyces hansenii CBS767]Q6BY20.2 RecName: Full=pH-response regulator protein palF/RIM8 [Debaryomyces hansenii CBS767]CAG84876.2 DEHA2A13112p [Debaryomyces hansenii CBS767]|eukprot:XP_456899.2 DEHA2A13112p [Debaryomyces hansenii CBS767]
MRRAVSKIIPNGPPRFLQSGSLLSGDTNFKYRIDFNSVDEFYISLADPHRSWLPGDEISGQIIFISKKDLANIVITLSLIGSVKINASSHSKLRPVKELLFHHTIKIYGDENSGNNNENGEEFSNGLFKGEHRFPFIVKLPNKRVFTSIDFGKGSIKYSLKAAVGNASSFANDSPAASPLSDSNNNNNNTTKNNFISKTKNLNFHNSVYTSEKIITLINPIDVSKLPRSKPKRLIIKDPRLSKKLSRTQSSTSTLNTVNTFNTLSSNNSDTTTNGEFHSNGNTPGNSASQSNSNSPLNGLDNARPQVIKVALEIPERGFLRGELIPTKLNINHSRKIQDLNGIIVTLVRVCRLSNGHENMVESFRKDLQQSVLPLYVDPNTFQSEINTNLRVPADAFPTISGCPLVSFQYFIEVLINLSGKSLILDSSNHHKPSISTDEANHSLLENPSNDLKYKFNFNSNASMNQNERSGFINTDKYKRMKKFLLLTTEVIIGTNRSNERSAYTSNERSNELLHDNLNSISPTSRKSSSVSGSNDSPLLFNQTGSTPPSQQGHQQPMSLNPLSEAIPANNFSTPPYFENQQDSPLNIADTPIPGYEEVSNNYHANSSLAPVQMPTHQHLSEKEQIRAHEASLLPSAPPLDDAEETETISPIDKNNEILENIEESGEEVNQLNNESNDSASSRHSQSFGFFTYQNSTSTTTPTNHESLEEEEEEEEDNLYHSNNLSNSHAEIDSESTDWVPNYETANHDILLENDHVSTGTNMHPGRNANSSARGPQQDNSS